MKHSRLSPSGSKAWGLCPGSIALQELIPVNELPAEDNSFADEGSCAHQVHENCLSSSQDAESFIGKEYYGVKVTQDMADHVQRSVDYIREIKKDQDAVMFVEHYCRLGHLGIKGMDGGTADTVLASFCGPLHIIDLKYGMGVVEVEGNSQLLIYAEGLLEELNSNYLFSEVILHIHQPRAAHPQGPLRTYRYSVDEVRNFAASVVVPAAEKVHAQFGLPAVEMELHPGDDQCRFCRAKSHCPAVHNKLVESFGDFGSEVEPVIPDAGMLSLEQCSYLLEHRALFESFFKSVYERLYVRAMDGEPVEGFKLVKGRTSRKYNTSDERIADEVLKFKSLSDTDIYTKKLLTPAQLEKEMNRKIGKAETAKLMSKFVEKQEGKLSLAKQSDSRKAVEISKTLENNFGDFNNG